MTRNKPNRQDLPSFLTATTWVECGHSLDDEDAFRRLVCGIRGIKPGPGIDKRLHEAPVQEDLWNVPFRKNPHFIGRDSYLTKIRRRLQKANTAVVGQAISGLGGIGKTETAVAYAYKYISDYKAVLWVKSDTVLEIERGFVAIHGMLWESASESIPEDAVRDVLRWLKDNPGWLLIFDNADTPEILRPYIPLRSKGHVLLTSRANVFSSLEMKDPIDLPPLKPKDATRFLVERSGRSRLSPEEKTAARDITRELECLPLALEQAAAYIETGASFAGYLMSYRHQPMKWLEKGTAIARGYPDSVATTWLVNFKAVEKVSPASAELLRLTAFLSPDDIPFELLTIGVSELGTTLVEALEGANEEPSMVHEILRPLASYSFVRIDEQQKTYSTHRLVQEVTKHALGADACRVWAMRAVATMSSVFPNPEFSNWPLCSRLAVHAGFVAEQATKYGLKSAEADRVWACLGYYLNSQGQYRLAEPLFKQSMEIRRTAQGEDHPDFATSLNNLAGPYVSMGRYEEAEPLYKQATEIRRTALGEDHPDFATSLNNLASLYYRTGRLEEAEPLYKQATEIRRTALGEDHPDFANSLNNLAALYDSMGRYEEAEPLYKQDMEITRTALGEEHPDFASSLDDLAGLYDSMGRYEEAEPLYQQATEIRRTALGEDHPSFATSLNNLARLYDSMGRYEEAEPLYQQATEIRRTALGEEHPDFASSLDDLASLYYSMGRYEEAEPLCKQATEIRRTALGEDHADFAISLGGLAELYRLMGRYEEAEPLCKQDMEITRTALGEDHPDTQTTRERYDLLLEEMAEREPPTSDNP
jgi:tetratricopeptide (TPR) repeat protein